LSKLTADDGEKIADKLVGPPQGGRKHDHVYVKWRGRVVAFYGIRRSSHEVGHDFIPRQLHVTMHQAIGLKRCPVSKDDYFNILRMHNHLPHLKCEVCATDDFDRVVADVALVIQRKSHKFTICADCTANARRADSQIIVQLEGIVQARKN